MKMNLLVFNLGKNVVFNRKEIFVKHYLWFKCNDSLDRLKTNKF